MERLPPGSTPFARIAQIGVVVRDLDAATAFYEALGVGPFHKTTGAAPIMDREVYGRPAPDVSNRIAIGMLGDIEIELVQPVSGASVQREFLETRGEGVNHLGFVVEDLEDAVSRLTERGFRVVSRGRVAHAGAFAYFDTDRVGGIIFELIKLPESGEDGETRSAVADAGDRP